MVTWVCGGGFSLHWQRWQCQDCPGGRDWSQGGFVALEEVVMRICNGTRVQPHESSVERKEMVLLLGRICFSLKSASSRQHRRKIHVVFSSPPSSDPGRMPLGDPQGFLRDAPRDASKTSPGMPLGKLERGSLWLTLRAGSCGSSGGAGSAAQGMDAGSLGRPVRSQRGRIRWLCSRAACWAPAGACAQLLELPAAAGVSPRAHSCF